jgi:hypothetical protein
LIGAASKAGAVSRRAISLSPDAGARTPAGPTSRGIPAGHAPGGHAQRGLIRANCAGADQSMNTIGRPSRKFASPLPTS